MINHIGTLEPWKYSYFFKPPEYKIPKDFILNNENLLYDNTVKNNLIDAINIFTKQNTYLLPLDVKIGKNTKKDFSNALFKYGSKKINNTSWVEEIRTYEDNIKSINDNNTGFVVKTGEASNVIIIDFDKITEWDDNVKNMLKICLDSNTLYSITPSGGYHIYFLYTDKLPKCRSGIFGNIDIRSNGGCGYYGYRDDGDYQIQNKKAKYKTIPLTVIDIIESYKKTDNRNNRQIKKALEALKTDGNKEPFKKLRDNNTFTPEPLSKFNINEETVSNLLDRLESNYYEIYNDWIIIAVILKRYELYDIYDTFSKKSKLKYNKNNNIKIYKALDPRDYEADFNINYIIILLNKQFKKIRNHIDFKILRKYIIIINH